MFSKFGYAVCSFTLTILDRLSRWISCVHLSLFVDYYLPVYFLIKSVPILIPRFRRNNRNISLTNCHKNDKLFWTSKTVDLKSYWFYLPCQCLYVNVFNPANLSCIDQKANLRFSISSWINLCKVTASLRGYIFKTQYVWQFLTTIKLSLFLLLPIILYSSQILIFGKNIEQSEVRHISKFNWYKRGCLHF